MSVVAQLRVPAVLLALATLLAFGTPAPARAPEAVRLFADGDENLVTLLDAGELNPRAGETFERAVRAARAGQDSVAEVLFRTVALSTPALSDWAWLMAADAAARRGADSIQVAQYLRESSSWLVREWGWRVRVHALAAGGAPGRAAAFAAGAADDVRVNSARIQAQRSAAGLMAESGDTAAAVALLRNSLRSQADPAALQSSAALLARISHSDADALLGARVLLRGGDQRSAAALLPRITRNRKLAGWESAELRIGLARQHLETRKYTEAQRIATALLTDSLAPVESRSAARVVLGRSLLRSGKRAAAQTELERALRSGSAPAIAEAAYVLGDLQADTNTDSALTLFRKSALTTPTSSYAAESMMRIGTYWFARSRYDSALHWFEEARVLPAFEQRATYWSARTRQKRQDPDAAELLRAVLERDPVSYYAFRASRAGAEPLTLPAGPVTNSEMELRMRRAFSRIELLRKAQLPDVASFELERLRLSFSDAPDALYTIAEQLHATGQTQRAISLGRELRQKQAAWDARLLRIVYPLPYRDLIVKEAEQHGVDPFLAAALIRQESLFNPRATSSAGARGLMQVMPQTGRQLARKGGARGYRAAALYDPEVNVRLGMNHLSALLRQHAGRLPYVLSAYNAGEHRLAQWQTFVEAVDDDLFVERIPFAETRDYVRIVQQNAEIYRTLYR